MPLDKQCSPECAVESSNTKVTNNHFIQWRQHFASSLLIASESNRREVLRILITQISGTSELSENYMPWPHSNSVLFILDMWARFAKVFALSQPNENIFFSVVNWVGERKMFKRISTFKMNNKNLRSVKLIASFWWYKACIIPPKRSYLFQRGLVQKTGILVPLHVPILQGGGEHVYEVAPDGYPMVWNTISDRRIKIQKLRKTHIFTPDNDYGRYN